MNSDQRSSELTRLMRQHKLVCSIIAAVLICADIYGVVARLGFILMAPFFVIALVYTEHNVNSAEATSLFNGIFQNMEGHNE